MNLCTHPFPGISQQHSTYSSQKQNIFLGLRQLSDKKSNAYANLLRTKFIATGLGRNVRH
jgi:hypothetical protein